MIYSIQITAFLLVVVEVTRTVTGSRYHLRRVGPRQLFQRTMLSASVAMQVESPSHRSLLDEDFQIIYRQLFGYETSGASMASLSTVAGLSLVGLTTAVELSMAAPISVAPFYVYGVPLSMVTPLSMFAAPVDLSMPYNRSGSGDDVSSSSNEDNDSSTSPSDDDERKDDDPPVKQSGMNMNAIVLTGGITAVALALIALAAVSCMMAISLPQ